MHHLIEPLENRSLLYALIPSGYSAIQTVQIRPKAGTYASSVMLLKGVKYFLRATGQALTGTNAYDGDAAFAAGASAGSAAWGISVLEGSTTRASTAWGSAQSDHIYKQYITPAATESISFSFANDGKVAASTLAVTIYGPVPSIRVAKIRNNRAVSAVPPTSLKAAGVFLPLNDRDWDHNGIADNRQRGAVKGDSFLLPVTLPAVTGATSKSHYRIISPSGVRVWLNADRTGKAAGIGLRATRARTVYLEGVSEQIHTAAVTLKVSVPFSGTQVEQDVRVTVFKLSGPARSSTSANETYGSDLPEGYWATAIGGTLNRTSQAGGISLANITWNSAGTDYANFAATKDFIWSLGVTVSA